VSDQHHTDPPPPDPAPPGAAVQVLAHLVRLDETGRLALLAVHGAYTLAIGVAMYLDDPATFTSASFVWMRFIPGHSTTVAALVATGGALILGGLLVRRHRPTQAAGLALIAGWDILMGIGFQRSRAAWEPSPETPYPPALYPVPLYMHLATVMIIHLVLLVAFARIRRAAAHLA